MFGSTELPHMSIGGLRLVEDASMVDTREDWSGVRSPSRAARRRRRGHPQRIRLVSVPKKELYRAGNLLFGHPVTLRAFCHTLEQCHIASS